MCGEGGSGIHHREQWLWAVVPTFSFLISPTWIVAYLTGVVKARPVKVQAQRLGLATRFFPTKSLVIGVVARKHADGGHWADFHYENLRYVVGNAVFGEIE